MSGEYSLSDIASVTGNNGGAFGNDGGWWIILLFIFIASFGAWGNNAGGGFGGSMPGYVSDNYALVTDNATLERKIDGVYAGQCDSTFAIVQNLNNGFASAQNTMTQGFAGLNTALVTQGYETRNAVTQDTIGNMQNTNLLQGAIKDCCCQTQQNVADLKYTIGATGADLGRQIERGFSDTNYAMATQNCATLQAIDKVGDRVIDYLSQQENAKLRDEVAQFRAQANAQYVVNEINKCPIPAYLTCNPNAPLNYSVVANSGCCGCNA